MEITKTKKNLVYFGCILVALSVQLSAMGLNNTMYVILQKMNGLAYYSLMAVFSSLGGAIMALVSGRLSDLLGSKNVTFVGALMALVMMVAMAFTKTLVVFIVCRAVLGFAAGVYTVSPFIICAEIMTPKENVKANGVLSAALALAVFLGSTIAGFLVDKGMVAVSIIYPGVVVVIGAALIFFNKPEMPRRQGVKFDMAGLILFATFVTVLSLTFSFINVMGVASPIIIAGFVVSVVAVVILLKVESKAEVPLVPIYLFKNRMFTALTVVAALVACYQLVMGVYIPVTGQQIMGLSSATTGLFAMPRSILCIVLPSLCAHWILKKPARNKTALIINAICVTVPFVILAFSNKGTPVWAPFVLLAVTGIGQAFLSVSRTPMAVQMLPPADLGAGLGLMTTATNLVMTLYTAVVGAAYQASSDTNLNGALHIVYVVTAVVGLVALILSVFFIQYTGDSGQASERPGNTTSST